MTFPQSACLHLYSGHDTCFMGYRHLDKKWPIHRCIYVYVHMYTHMHMTHTESLRQGPASPGVCSPHSGRAGGRPAQCDKHNTCR